MLRTFLALAIPERIADQIDDAQSGLRGVHWTPSEALHLTLVFLGEQNRHALADLDAAMLQLDAPRFALRLAGVGSFGGEQPRSAHVGVAPNPELRRLQEKTATAARRAGIAIDERRFTPHVTIARWSRGAVSPAAIAEFEARGNLFRSDPFDVDAVRLYRSDLGRHGPQYEELAAYPLREPTAPAAAPS